MEIPPPSLEHLKEFEIMGLKNNKVSGLDGLPAELFKTGCSELAGRMHQFIYKICLEEIMPPKIGNLEPSVLF